MYTLGINCLPNRERRLPPNWRELSKRALEATGILGARTLWDNLQSASWFSHLHPLPRLRQETFFWRPKEKHPGERQKEGLRDPRSSRSSPAQSAPQMSFSECSRQSVSRVSALFAVVFKYPPSFPLAEHPLPFRIGGWVGSAAELQSLCSGCSCRTQRRWWRRCRDWGA